MSDDHDVIRCEACGQQPELVRLGSMENLEHASFGVECGCAMDSRGTPVGSYVDVNDLPDRWSVAADD
jgi:hypothetical protein